MSEICILNRSSLDDAAVAFAAAACDLQLRRDFVQFWPGLEYLPVRFYSDAADLPVVSGLARLMVISDTIDIPNVLGFHTADPLIRGVVLAQGDQTSVTLSHECLEMAADPMLGQWIRRPDGKDVPVEIADPVEADSYLVDIMILGQVRRVRVSNFVTPAWFGLGVLASIPRTSTPVAVELPPVGPPYDFNRTLTAPFQLASGGYCVVRDKDGNVSDEWSRTQQPESIVRTLRKRWNSTSRTYRRGVR